MKFFFFLDLKTIITYLVSKTKRWTNSSNMDDWTKILEVHKQISPWFKKQELIVACTTLAL